METAVKHLEIDDARWVDDGGALPAGVHAQHGAHAPFLSKLEEFDREHAPLPTAPGPLPAAFGPYSLTFDPQRTSSEHLNDAWRLTGPVNVEQLAFGSDGHDRLERKARDLNAAYQAGAAAGRSLAELTHDPVSASPRPPVAASPASAKGVEPWMVGSAVDPRFSTPVLQI